MAEYEYLRNIKGAGDGDSRGTGYSLSGTAVVLRKKGLQKAPSVCVQFGMSRRGKKMLTCCHDKYEGMYRSGEGGGMPTM